MITPYAAEYDIRRGDAFTGVSFRFKSTEGVSFWDNFEVKAQLRQTPDGALLHEFDLTDAAVTDEDGVGVLTVPLEIEPADTADFDPGKYVGDMELTSDSFPKSTVVVMKVHVFRDVTRA
jgi:hypothetical protein